MIIIDDASPDGTLEVAKELQKIYGEDKLVRAESFPSYPLLSLVLHLNTFKLPSNASSRFDLGVETQKGQTRTWYSLRVWH